MRMSNLTNDELTKDAGIYRRMREITSVPSEHVKLTQIADALDELVDRRLRSAVEASLAYERAGGVLESSCSTPELLEGADEDWYDLGDIDEMVGDLDMEVEYLESRGLLIRHPQNPDWVSLRDESEASS